jgi:hypothetical protein
MISSRDHIKPQRRRRRIEVIPSHLVFLQARAREHTQRTGIFERERKVDAKSGVKLTASTKIVSFCMTAL